MPAHAAPHDQAALLHAQASQHPGLSGGLQPHRVVHQELLPGAGHCGHKIPRRLGNLPGRNPFDGITTSCLLSPSVVGGSTISFTASGRLNGAAVPCAESMAKVPLPINVYLVEPLA